MKQRNGSDCGICCLALLTGRTYEDVKATIGDAWRPRRGLESAHDALERLGFVWGMGTDDPRGYVCITDARAMVSAPLLWGRRALASVPSLNIEGGWHMVYWDGLTLHDPSPKRTNRSLHSLVPREVYLFNEAIRAR